MSGGSPWRFDCTKNQGQDNKMIITALDNRLEVPTVMLLLEKFWCFDRWWLKGGVHL